MNSTEEEQWNKITKIFDAIGIDIESVFNHIESLLGVKVGLNQGSADSQSKEPESILDMDLSELMCGSAKLWFQNFNLDRRYSRIHRHAS